MWADRLTLLTLQRFRPLFARVPATLINARTVWTGDVRTALTYGLGHGTDVTEDWWRCPHGTDMV